MKVTLGELTQYRKNERLYLIEDKDYNIIVIYGTKYCEVLNRELYDVILSFLNNKVGWDYVARRIRHDRDDNYREGENNTWSDFNGAVKDKIVDVKNLFIDGKKKEKI